MSTTHRAHSAVPRNGQADLVSAVVLSVCLAGLVIGVLLYVSPAVTPERFTIWSLLGIIILMFAATPVSLLSLVATAYFVVGAVWAGARRSRLLVVLWVATAALTAAVAVLLYLP